MTRKRWLALGIVGAVVIAVGVAWFEPHKLFIDDTVNEAAPTADAVTRTDEPDAMKRDTLEGDFVDLEHDASGRAVVIGDTLRFEDFQVENGPDLVVYLSSAAVDGSPRDLGEDFVDLGDLKGNIGDQNYRIPAGTDLTKYKTAVIWCRRFTVPFAAATLQ